MGSIHQEVRDKHLNQHPEEEEMLKPFLSGFDVTYGAKRYLFSTQLSVYMLKPEDFIKEAYGITNEIMLVYSAYSTTQPRSIQAADNVLNEYPFKSRADILSYFLISDDEKISEWLRNYYLDTQESRIIIPFSKNELVQNKGDGWFVRNKLSQNFFDRDLFGYTLPLTEDTYYFGRQQLLANYIDSIRRSENKGVFGLRKTGKTSLLFKIQRTIVHEKIGHVFFYDCKSPSFRRLRWNQFLGEIINNIADRLGIQIRQEFGPIKVIKAFRHVMKIASSKGIKIVLIFDEIEYISFKSLTDWHWKKDYIEFWQTMWSVQSVHRNLVYIIAGVNPSVVEVDKVSGIQNPLFGIVQYEYLTGFSEDELKAMLKALGKRMGMNFDHHSISYLFEWYGGHPMLTRLACSWFNRDLKIKNKQKPVEIKKDQLVSTQKSRDADLIFYCKHVVSELKDFYPEEYTMLELLASGQIHEFRNLALKNDSSRHLESYGLLKFDENNTPKIILPVIGQYIGLELAKKEGRNTIYKVIEISKREEWLEQRKYSILRDFRMLEKIIQSKRLPILFGKISIPEADEFNKIKIVENKYEFGSFINICNRCFVESIEYFGKSIGDSNYFWGIIKNSYKSLHLALERIKVYRHEEDHLILMDNVNDRLLDFLREDLENQNPSQVLDLYFVLQQRTLDALLSSIQIEMNKYN